MKLATINIGTSKVVAAFARDDKTIFAKEQPLLAQHPHAWEKSVLKVLEDSLVGNTTVKYLSVCATSGTFVVVDKSTLEVLDFCMYNTSRSSIDDSLKAKMPREEFEKLNEYPSTALVWHLRSERNLSAKDVLIVPQATWVAYRLANKIHPSKLFAETDYSNSRKFGFSNDKTPPKWEHNLLQELDLSVDMFPTPVEPGKRIGAGSVRCPSGCSVEIENIFHGVTDSTAEALFLLDGRSTNVCVIAGSTSTVRAICNPSYIAPFDGYVKTHPVDPNLAWITAWATTGENIRRVVKHAKLSLGPAVEQAMGSQYDQSYEKYVISRTPLPIVAQKPDPYRSIRGLIEAMISWEASIVGALKTSDDLGINFEMVRMIGGTTKNKKVMEARLNSYQTKIEVIPAFGTLGAIYPGLLKNGHHNDLNDLREYISHEQSYTLE